MPKKTSQFVTSTAILKVFDTVFMMTTRGVIYDYAADKQKSSKNFTVHLLPSTKC